MIAAWMVMSVLLGGAVVLGAVALDGVCRALRTPRRWTWFVALWVLAILTVLAPLRRMSDAGVFRLPTGIKVTEASTTAVAATVSLQARVVAAARAVVDFPIARLARSVQHVVPPVVDQWLLIAWVACSVAMLLLGVLVYHRLRMAQRTWPVSSLHGERVHVSPDSGPAVLGFLRGAIVVPPWLIECTADVQRVVVAHEREHMRARDPMLLTLGGAAVLLLPWNPAAWWMLARLRLAVELDCDRRVLASGVRTRDYGTLLIDLAGRTTGMSFTAPLVGLTMLAERTSHLERRIVAMSAPRPRLAALRIAAGSLVALVAALAACESRLPTENDVTNMTAASAQQAAAKVGLMSANDSLTTYYVNGNAVRSADAHALSPDQIATVRVQRDAAANGKGSVWITTRSAADARGGAVFLKMPEGKTGASFEGLYVVDGKHMDQSGFVSLRLNPSDIASIEVLKGPRAAALYPSDAAAAHGVIQITTKHAAQ